MANPRRNRNVQTPVTLADLLSRFKGTPADSPREKVRQRAKLADIQTRMNLPETLPNQTTNLLQAQPQQAAASLMALSPMTDVTTAQTQSMESLIQPLLSPVEESTKQITNVQQNIIPKYTRAGNFFAKVGGFQEATPQELAQATPEQVNFYNQEKVAARNRGIGEMLLMLSDALGGRDVAMRALERQQVSQQGLQSEQNIQRLQQAGVSSQGINLYLAGLPLQDVMELEGQEIGLQPRTAKQLAEEVEKEKLELPESIRRLQKAPQAFGAVDALQQGINVALGPILGTPAKDTAEAVTEIKVLNERVREKFINQYSGRPSVYLNQRVDQLLPTSMFLDEAVAASKYESTRRVLQEGLNEMKDKIESGAYKGGELIEVENNYKSIKSLIDDVDVVINALKKTTPSKETLEPITGIQTQGIYDPYFTD